MSSSSETVPTIGIITALPKEYAAVQAMMDNGRDVFIPHQRTFSHYYLGEMPAAGGWMHTVVLALVVTMGNNAAAIWGSNLTRDWSAVHTVIMVGIAGGVPYPEKPEDHVRLGDVVVSSEAGVVQYDFVKKEVDEIVPRLCTHHPSASFLHAVRRLEAEALSGHGAWATEIDRARSLQRVTRPDDTSDILYRFERAPNGELARTEVEHPLDPNRVTGQPRVFVGSIASSNTLQKDPFKRDKLREQFGVKAVEMEGSGIADAMWIAETEYLVVRGICDYCDPAKNDTWQGYAAVAAAAYTRALLQRLPSADAGSDDASMPAVLPLSEGSVKGAAPTKDTYRVLVDVYHGEELFKGRHRHQLERCGFEVVTTEQAYTPAQLAECDVLVIWFTRYYGGSRPQFSKSELAMIKDYLDRGGSAFLIGLGWVWAQYDDLPPIEDYPLNLIARDYRVFFTEATISSVAGVHYTDCPVSFSRPFMREHPITKGVSKISSPDSIPGSLIVESPAVSIVWGSDDTEDSDGAKNPVVLAIADRGKTRIVCLQHCGYVTQFDCDNWTLLKNILTWLAIK